MEVRVQTLASSPVDSCTQTQGRCPSTPGSVVSKPSGVTASTSTGRVGQRKVQELTAGNTAPGGACARRAVAYDLLDQLTFIGTLKSMNDTSGFISCEETHSLFGRDVMVHRAYCEQVPVGDLVSFRVEMKRGQPQACDLSWPPCEVQMCAQEEIRAPPPALGQDFSGHSWTPSNEAHRRCGMAALAAHELHPKQHPPPVREGAFVGWRSN